MRRIILLCALLTFAAAAVAHAQERDGKQWLSWTESQRYSYMTGILDGVTTGNDFSAPILSKGSIVLYKEDKACQEKVQTTYDYNTSRFFFGISLSEFVEGINAFYKDPANLAIPVNRAVRVVVLQRKNIPEARQILDDLRQEWSGS